MRVTQGLTRKPVIGHMTVEVAVTMVDMMITAAIAVEAIILVVVALKEVERKAPLTT